MAAVIFQILGSEAVQGHQDERGLGEAGEEGKRQTEKGSEVWREREEDLGGGTGGLVIISLRTFGEHKAALCVEPERGETKSENRAHTVTRRTRRGREM